MVTGVGVSLVVAVLFNLFVFSVIDARLYRVFIAEGAGVTAREDALYDTLSGTSHVISVLLAFSLGGLVVDGMVAASPGLNGAVGAAVAALGASAWYAGPLVPWIWRWCSPGRKRAREDVNFR